MQPLPEAEGHANLWWIPTRNHNRKEHVLTSDVILSHIFAVFNGESQWGFHEPLWWEIRNILGEALFLLLIFCSVILPSNVLYKGRKTRLAVCEVQQKMR